MRSALCLFVCLPFVACSSEEPAAATPDSGVDASACTLQANTSSSGTESPSGCVELVRDTSACRATREAAGLAGFWLRFSCRVTLTVSGGEVTAAFDGQPDYKSNYFTNGSPCREAYAGTMQNPNTIAAKAYAVPIPLTPNTTATPEGLGVMGVAVNAIPLFSNAAAPGDDIFLEVKTFDRCGAHPTQTGQYHYHSEPYAISYDDESFIGVLRDGYPVYGRRDPDASLPTLDEYGGHTGVTIDSPTTPVYHYHLNLQTSVAPTSVGQQEWFVMTGNARGSMPACASCGR